MSRTVPAELQAHLDQAATTTCRLLKIKTSTGTIFGLTTLDVDIPYDDDTGDGVVDYIATNGFDPSAIVSDTGLSVSNAEGYAFLSNEVPGITEEMVRAGELDDATWVCYLINFNDLTAGRHIILDAGDVGAVRLKHGILWMPELLSYMMRLKQPIGGVWSRTCRAVFGSPADSQTGCGVDITPLWVSGTITAVGVEADRDFTGSAVQGSGQPTPVPGRVQFLTGANAGREYAIESVEGTDVSLIETTHYPMEIGDTYRIRPDCAKHYERDCIGIWGNGVNFKGEPTIPVGDAIQSQTPAAQIPGGSAFAGTSEE